MLYSLITFDAGDLASTTAYIGIVFNDFKLLIFVVIGLSIAFAILNALFDFWRIGPKWKKRGE